MFEREVNAAIAQWAPYYGVPISPALVHGIIEKESVNGRYLTTAERGGQTSRGPMMVLDSTAIDLGADDPSTLEDPATGIWYGVHYLAQLLKRFQGDAPRAVSAYNTGPSATFINQTYVSDVFRFASAYSMAFLPAVVIGILALVLLLPRRRLRTT